MYAPSPLINLDEIDDWEKATILKVLKRNNAVKELEERRVLQLAVRVQLERMTDQRSVRAECELKTKTGQWHREMINRRCPGGADIPQKIYRSISTDLTSTGSKRSSGVPSTSSTPINFSDSHFHNETQPQFNGMDIENIKAWVEKHAVYNHNDQIKKNNEEDENCANQRKKELKLDTLTKLTNLSFE